MRKRIFIFLLLFIIIGSIIFPLISNAGNEVMNNQVENNAIQTNKNESKNSNANSVQVNKSESKNNNSNSIQENKIEIKNNNTNLIQSNKNEITNNNTTSNKNENVNNTNTSVEKNKNETNKEKTNSTNSTGNDIQQYKSVENYTTMVENLVGNKLETKNLEETKTQIKELGIKYSSHVQDIGWQDFKENGKTSGTTGRNLKIEAMKISLINNTKNIKLKYATYIQGSGWQKDHTDGYIAGTTGKNLRMEAIKIWLENTEEYSIAYRTHVQDYGWQGWVYDGAISGILVENKKIEAIEIKIVPKVEKTMSVRYSSHVQDLGWEKEKIENDISGTTGQNKKVEAVKIKLINNPSNISIRYMTYVQKAGWQDWKKNNEISGTTGRNLKVYGLRIELVGTKEYSVYYRAHIQDYGWGRWQKNGTVAGDISNNRKIEAIEIKIVKEKNNVDTSLGVKYYSYLQGNSSKENYFQKNGEETGTTGQNRKMEAIQIELLNAPQNAHIKYKVHVQDIGWMDWKKDRQIAGVIDRNLKIEAIKIELENMDKYTIEYSVHVQDKGWTGWYIDGEIAGTTGENKKIEALKIRIVPKYKRYYVGIDVSQWQHEIDFNKIKATNKVNFMIARIGWYSETRKELKVDNQFERNYKEAKSHNIPVGAYFYSYATSVEGAKKEAEEVVRYLKNKNQTKFELPIFYDIEDKCQTFLDKNTRTKMCIEFCEILKKAGYKVGVYSYDYYLVTQLDVSQFPSDYALWVANYSRNKDGTLPENIYKFAEKHDIWQYSSKGRIDGIDTDVDMNICYRRYF